MPKNLRILHEGMGWPIGAVIPCAALAKDGADHISLGAVEPTAMPVSHPVSLPDVDLKSASVSEAEKAFEKIRTQNAELQGQLAGAEHERDRAKAEVEKLKAENAELWKQLEDTEAAGERKAAAARQAQLDAGPAVTPPAK